MGKWSLVSGIVLRGCGIRRLLKPGLGEGRLGGWVSRLRFVLPWYSVDLGRFSESLMQVPAEKDGLQAEKSTTGVSTDPKLASKSLRESLKSSFAC